MTASTQLLDALNSLFSQKYHSLAQYILDAQPYLPAGMEATLKAIETVAATDQAFADRLAEAIEALGGVPQLAIFSPEVASLNYLALDYLRGVLIADLRGEQAEAERACVLAAAEDAPEVKALLTELAEATAAQIRSL